MRTSEWVVVAYFLYLLTSGLLLRAPVRTLLRVLLVALSTCGAMALLALERQASSILVLRDWLPGGWVLAGYWATGLLYRGPSGGLERALEAVDRRLFDAVGSRRMPRPLREVLELAYLFCYPLVPAGIGVLYALGERRRADAFWTVVLCAAFAAYGVLPWAGTRPPRSLEKAEGPRVRKCEAEPADCPTVGPSDCRTLAPTSRLDARPAFFQRVNLAVLAGGSIQVNTFPSGHAASAWAVALFMTVVPGAPWPAFVAVAAAIGAGAVVGRYHYFLDVVAGTAVAFATFALVNLVGK